MIHQVREHQEVTSPPHLSLHTAGTSPGCFSACFFVSATENSLSLTTPFGSKRADLTRKVPVTSVQLKKDEVLCDSTRRWKETIPNIGYVICMFCSPTQQDASRFRENSVLKAKQPGGKNGLHHISLTLKHDPFLVLFCFLLN